jgi:alpha-L-fucosidase
MTMNGKWGYNAYDTNWKSSREMVRMLVDVASKGGNYLLNIGPRADGTFPPEAVERLKEIGAWTKRYGAAIYGTQASPLDALSWGRCTLKRQGDDTLMFLHVFDTPASGELVLAGLGNEPLSAGYLSGPRIALPVERRGSDLVVKLVSPPQAEPAYVVTLGLKGAPIVYRAPRIEAASEIFVRPLKIELSVGAGLTAHYTLDGSLPDERSPRYTAPIQLLGSGLLRAVGVHAGKPVTTVVERAFTRVEPAPALDATGAAPGLRREVFGGDWERLPDFSVLAPRSVDVVDTIGVPAREERVGARFAGLITVEHDDVYEFALTSDDGSRLWVDGALVVDNDGLHGTVEARGRVALAAGAHALRVEWFNRTGGAELGLKTSRIGQPLEPVSARTLLHLR